jgi:3-phosphoshikimate 1-carboxyvinyltransferase
MMLTARPSGPLTGLARAPGDKSVSHRALILGAMARGETLISGLLEGADVLATGAAMRAFGADVEKLGDGRWRVLGKGGYSQPGAVIDCGNSGTGVRLIMGAAAGFPIEASFTGDASLRSRPMGRVLTPLKDMGLTVSRETEGRLPLTIRGGGLKAISYRLPVASAQVKSAILLAGLHAEGVTEVIESEPTRDHTELMIRGFGAADVSVRDGAEGRVIRLSAPRAFGGMASLVVPGDPSSAAFPIVAALITPGSDIVVENVMMNPLRTGLIVTLREMGAWIEATNLRRAGGEEVADLRVRHSALRGVDVPAARAPSMIDEYPILAVAAAYATGTTRMNGIGEMRVKESDRIALMARGLTACGVNVEEEPEALIVHGGPVRGGAIVHTEGDHRIAMSHLVLGLAAREEVSVDEPEMIATSFPEFSDLMRALGANLG